MKLGSCLTYLVVILAVNIIAGGYCTEYTVETWATYFKGHTVDVPAWPCYVCGLFIGQFTIPAALITWVIVSAL